MALTTAYATVEDYLQHIGPATKAAADPATRAEIEFWLDATSRYWERATGRLFGKDAAAVVRYFRYDGDYTREGYPYVRLDADADGCPGIADSTGMSVKVDTDADGSFADETAWASTDYELWPLNWDKGAESQSRNKLVVPSWSTQSLSLNDRLSVTAIYGMPSVPSLIKLATMEWAAVMRNESPRASGRVPELDDVTSLSPYHLSIFKRIRESYWQPVVA